MARLFASGSSEGLYFNRSADWIGSQNFCVHCWFYPTTDQTQTIVGFVDKDVGTSYVRLNHQGGVSGDPVRINRRAGGSSTNLDSSGSGDGSVTLNAWNTGGMFFNQDSIGDSDVFCNGTSQNGTLGNAIDAAWDRLSIGYIGDSSPAAYFDGRIAEVAIWAGSGFELDAAEWAALNQGFSPLLIRPASLVCYIPLGGITENDADTDLIFGDTASVTGTPTTAEHPPIIYPAPYHLGPDVATTSNTTLTADAGSYTVAGTAASTLVGHKLAADAGSYSVSGTASTTLYGQTLSADAGAYTVTGTAASTLVGHKLTADAGSYTVTGTAATTSKGGATIIADAGSYSVTGTAASLLRGLKLSADAGSYSVTGTAAATLKGQRVTADAGSYTVTGTDASLLRGLVLTAVSGAYSVSGTAATTSTTASGPAIAAGRVVWHAPGRVTPKSPARLIFNAPEAK